MKISNNNKIVVTMMLMMMTILPVIMAQTCSTDCNSMCTSNATVNALAQDKIITYSCSGPNTVIIEDLLVSNTDGSSSFNLCVSNSSSASTCYANTGLSATSATCSELTNAYLDTGSATVYVFVKCDNSILAGSCPLHYNFKATCTNNEVINMTALIAGCVAGGVFLILLVSAICLCTRNPDVIAYRVRIFNGQNGQKVEEIQATTYA